MRTMRRLCLLSLALVGCSAAPSAPASASPEPTASVWIPVSSAAASASVTEPPAKPAPAAPVWEVEEQGKGTPLSADLDGSKVPDAPCFGDRVYRGTIGQEHVTLKIATDGDRLSGLAHYDIAGGSIEVSGKRQADSFSLQEKGAGRLDGKCESPTGRLVGRYELRGKTQAFSLAPRPQGEAAIHVVRENVKVRSLCAFELSAPRVFGLAAPGVERTVNAVLSQDGFSYASREVRADVKRCALQNEVSAGGGFSIVHNASDVLSVYFSGYVIAANAAHPALIGPEPVVVDLQSGKRLAIGDVVSDEAAFREAILACDEPLREELEWGGKDSYRQAPRWVVVPGGIAVVVGSVPPIMNGMQGTGPIASFASLAARKLLRADSPVARLWAGVTPAAKGAPFCQAMMGSGEILAIRQRPPSP